MVYGYRLLLLRSVWIFDFDYLFTELLDLNSLLQRMGRLNRKGEKEIEGYNCFVYYDGANIKCGRKGFIDKNIVSMFSRCFGRSRWFTE